MTRLKLQSLSRILVRRMIGKDPCRAELLLGLIRLEARIGRTGLSVDKREGDGRTPLATLRPMQMFYRNDRIARPYSFLPTRPSRSSDGWCDAVGHGQYNRLIRLPFAQSHETMQREDGQYDIVIELDWNRHPRVQGRGSAIFLHITSTKGTGTAGCIALSAAHLRWLVTRLSPRTRFLCGFTDGARRK